MQAEVAINVRGLNLPVTASYELVTPMQTFIFCVTLELHPSTVNVNSFFFSLQNESVGDFVVAVVGRGSVSSLFEFGSGLALMTALCTVHMLRSTITATKVVPFKYVESSMDAARE